MNYRIFITVLFLMVNLLISRQGISQGTTTLRVIDMPGFPDIPQDTVYEQGPAYTFDVTLVNGTIDTIQNVIINLRVDSNTSAIFSGSPSQQMLPGDTAVLQCPPFNFTQPQFKAGNNIVVVWPVINGAFLPVDTFYTNVFFVTLNSLGISEAESLQLSIYPVPASDLLHLETASGNPVEYVRIFDISGQLVMETALIENRNINIHPLGKGLYILEAVIDGTTIRKKFLRE